MRSQQLRSRTRPSLHTSKSYVYDDENDPDKLREQGVDVDPGMFRHDYVITNKSQVTPLYVVEFKLDGDADRVYDDDYLLNQLGENVQRVRMHKQEHNDTEQKTAITDTKHIAEQFLKEMQCKDEMANFLRDIKSDMEDKRLKIQQSLEKVDDKLRLINDNSAKIEEQVYELLQDTLLSLQEHTQSKMNALLSEEMELRRQFEQLNWMEEFLEYSKDRVAPTDALEMMRTHVVARQTLERMWKEPRLDSIKADIVLSGSMSVSLESGSSSSSPSSSASSSISTAVVETKTTQQSAAPAVSVEFAFRPSLLVSCLKRKLTHVHSSIHASIHPPIYSPISPRRRLRPTPRCR